ncbi:MAG: tetratricopeptide repeat protein [Magnetococcales bacterium]|nr:tetratricopeptide repeat protein [Magnetococcales bacterium]NGZ26822.1 tetratricopeptide repeat protein [Magnetococcales bacterium]
MSRSHNKLITSVLGLTLLMYGAGGFAALKSGDVIPSFQANGSDGKAVSEKNFSGQTPGVLYLYKTEGCDSCQNGLVQLKEVGSQFKDDLQIVAISKDKADAMGATFPVATGDADIFKNFSASLLPTTYLVGPNGKIMKIVQGGGKNMGDMLASLAESQLQTKKPEKAKVLFLKASKAGDSVVARAGVAYSTLKEGNVSEAENSFKEMAKSQDKQLAMQGKEGLAEVLFQQGKNDEALKVANEVLQQDPNRAMANLVKGKTLNAKGNKAEAEKALVMASAETSTSDFSWQKAEANLAMGNMQLQGKNSNIALKSFRKASDHNPYFAEALSNEGVALKDMGEPEKAMEVFQKLQKVDPSDKLVHSLLRQAQAAIAQKQDLERQKYIDGLVKDLLQQFKDNKAKPAPADDWTSPAMAISILGFQNNDNGSSLMGRIGLEGILQDELTQALQAQGVKVVDRAIIDKVLQELKMGSSELADPDTALKLGKIMAAHFITTGSFFNTGKKNLVNMRLVDVETSNIVLSLSESEKVDPTEVAPKFAKAIRDAIVEKYPLKGRLAAVEGDTIIVNMGKKHGVTKGQKFNVLADGEPIMVRGKPIPRQTKVGTVEITEVDEDIAYAKSLDKSGNWTKDQKIIQKN